jgi:hypothetical protein
MIVAEGLSRTVSQHLVPDLVQDTEHIGAGQGGDDEVGGGDGAAVVEPVGSRGRPGSVEHGTDRLHEDLLNLVRGIAETTHVGHGALKLDR